MKYGRWSLGIYFHKSNQITVLYRPFMLGVSDSVLAASLHISGHIAHLRQQSHNSKSVIFQEKLLKVSSAIIFYECNDDTTALQRRVLQTALWHYTC